MRIVGFGIHTARSLNCFLIFICVLMLWQAVLKLGLIVSAKVRLILITLYILELGLINNSEPGRPDVLMASVAAIAFLIICSIQLPSFHYIPLSLICALFPLTGLALSAYAVIFSTLLLLYLRKRFLKEFISIIVGLSLGFLCLYILYSVNGVCADFIRSIVNNPTVLGASEKAKLGGIFGNEIFKILVILCLILSAYRVMKGRFKWYSMLSFGLISVFWVPLGMRLAGAFQFCYSWMVVVPLATCVCCSLDEELSLNKKIGEVADYRLNFTFLGTLLSLFLIFNPYLDFLNLVYNWNSSDYSKIEDFVWKNTKDNDNSEWLYTESISYFAAKKKHMNVILPPYLGIIPAYEKSNISTLILRSQEFPSLQKNWGDWYNLNENLVVQVRGKTVELEVYRRK